MAQLYLVMAIILHSWTECLMSSIEKPSFYRKDGDIMIGGLLTATSDENCNREINSVSSIELIEVIAYTVEKINKNETILPNITIGFRIADICRTSSVAQVQSLQFLPTIESADHQTNNLATDLTKCNLQSSIMNPLVNLPSPLHQHQVAAIIGTDSTETAASIAGMLSTFKVPIVSPSVSGILLENRDHFSHLTRINSPDRFIGKAMIDLLIKKDWTYIGIMYDSSIYGLENKNAIELEAKRRDICIGGTYALHKAQNDSATNLVYNSIALDIKGKMQLNALVLFAYRRETHKLLDMLRQYDLQGRLVLIFSEAADKKDFLKGYGDFRAIVMGVYTNDAANLEGFDQRMKNPNTVLTTQNPWFQRMYAVEHNCNWPKNLSSRSKSPNTSCFQKRKDTNPTCEEPGSRRYLYADAVNTVAFALDKMIRTKCPSAFVSIEKLRQCLTSHQGNSSLQEFIRNVDFQGYTGHISFDRNGSIKDGKYTIKLLQTATNGQNSSCFASGQSFWQKIGTWRKDHLAIDESVFNDSVLTLKSSCAPKCEKDERREPIPGFSCCHECRKCAINKILKNNTCHKCQKFYWPDVGHIDECVEIRLTYLELRHPAGIVFFILNIIGIICCLMAVHLLLRYREKSKLVKASSPEICIIIVMGALLGFVSGMIEICKPTEISCLIRRVMYHLNGTIMFGALLTKTVRISRILDASSSFKRKLKFVSTRSQFVIVFLIVLLQIAVIITCIMIGKIEPRKNQPDEQKPEVELFCSQPNIGFIPPISLNACLLLICCWFGHKTRKAPDNFKECSYINAMTGVTLLVWLAYSPTYFLLSREIHRTILIILSVFLDSAIVVGFLLIPKFYAVFWLEGTCKLIYLKDPDTGMFYVAKRSAVTAKTITKGRHDSVFEVRLEQTISTVPDTVPINKHVIE